MENPKIFSDKYYLHCLDLAKTSKGSERYGSLLIQNNKIIGEGHNRAIVHKYFKLERILRQGYANHAEIEALNQALFKEEEVEGSDIYCAGYFPDLKELFFHEEYTCTKCTPHLEKYGIKNIFLPTPSGWVKRPFKEAKEEAKKYQKGTGTHEKRINSSIRGHNFEDLLKII